MSERMSKPRPRPRAKRPPVSALIVEPIAAVTMRWRVFGLVDAHRDRQLAGARPAAPLRVAASFTSCRSEIHTEPRPTASASRTSCSIGRGSETRPGSV